jgi:hypothetical protein
LADLPTFVTSRQAQPTFAPGAQLIDGMAHATTRHSSAAALVSSRGRLVAAVNSRKVAKHFAIEITHGYLAFQHRTEQIEAEARLAGIYVIRTSVPVERLATNEAVEVVCQGQRLTPLRLSRLTPSGGGNCQ